MNVHLNPSTTHPSDAQLDQLRAGLFDARPAERDALQTHLRECGACRERASLWTRAAQLLDDGAAERRLASILGTRRRRALRGIGAARRSRAPFAAALAVAVTAVAIGLGVFFVNDRNDPDATVTATAPSPDFYTDIDFYIYLMEKQANSDASPNS
jgi:predicted anti-sigma-YlaC factor YlaD